MRSILSNIATTSSPFFLVPLTMTRSTLASSKYCGSMTPSESLTTDDALVVTIPPAPASDGDSVVVHCVYSQPKPVAVPDGFADIDAVIEEREQSPETLARLVAARQRLADDPLMRGQTI